MLKSFDRLSQRIRDSLLTVAVSFLLFVLGPMQAARLVTGQHFGYFFGLVLVPAARLSVFAKPLCSWPDRGHDPFVARSRNRVC
jgi:hypothetical protein